MSNLHDTLDTSNTGHNHNASANGASSNNLEQDAPISEKMRATLHDTVDTLAEKAEVAEKSIRTKAGDSKEALTEKQQQIQESWEASSVRKYATENPVATAGIVFVAGALFGKLLSRN